MASSDDDKTVRFVVICISIVISLMFLSISSCTLIDSFDDAEDQLARAQVITATNQKDIAKTNSIKELIEKGVDPVAARCAVVGWDKNNTGETLICQRVAGQFGTKVKIPVRSNVSVD